jgi:nucleotide-binding universal stress UspA family protein
MPFKTIVAIIQGHDDAERVLDCAISFAERFDSYVIGVHAEALPVAYTSAVGFPDTEFIQISSEANKERAKSLADLFSSRMNAARHKFEWRSHECYSGDSAHSGIASARCADLVIAAQRDPNAEPTATADIDSLLFESGRPVLVVPHAGPSHSSYRRVVIAWNGSREAARAAFDALPMITRADHAEVFVIDPPDDVDQNTEASGAEIAAALARHGAKVTVTGKASGGRSVDQLLQEQVVATGADLLVLGAYSHSWLRQLLFGGVTRTVLQSMPIATFISR